jgi:hypothetical protein
VPRCPAARAVSSGGRGGTVVCDDDAHRELIRRMFGSHRRASSSAHEGQRPHPYPVFVYRDHRPADQILRAERDDALDKFRRFRPAQPFEPEAQDRRRPRVARREQRVKVGVKRDDRLTRSQCMIKDLGVGRLGETQFTHVVGDKTAPSQLLGGAAR